MHLSLLNFILRNLHYVNKCLLHARVDGAFPHLGMTTSTRKTKYGKMKNFKRETTSQSTEVMYRN